MQNQGSQPSTAALGNFAGGGAYAVPTVFDKDTERLSETHKATIERLLGEAKQR